MKHEPFVKLKPVFKDYLWGGEKLKALFFATEERVAEAWLLSAHPDGQSVIAEGGHQGMTLGTYIKHIENEKAAEKNGEELPFPILVKMIDARQTLSVQVHPGDDYARMHEKDSGKSEMWLVLESEPDAFLYVGFNRVVTKEEVRRRVMDGTIETLLHKMLTHAGDVIFIPAGTVHAIGAGNLILEIQQSSNATYRLYDYNRRDAQGKLRQLHLEKALDVLDYKQYSAPSDGEQTFETGEIARCKYFKVFLHDVNGSFTQQIPDGSFASVICIGGEGNLKRDGKQTSLRRGDSLYLPAGSSSAQLQGRMQIVVCYANA